MISVLLKVTCASLDTLSLLQDLEQVVFPVVGRNYRRARLYLARVRRFVEHKPTVKQVFHFLLHLLNSLNPTPSYRDKVYRTEHGHRIQFELPVCLLVAEKQHLFIALIHHHSRFKVSNMYQGLNTVNLPSSTWVYSFL